MGVIPVPGFLNLSLRLITAFGQVADGFLFPLWRRGHELTNGIENNLELDIIFLFQGSQLPGQAGMCGQDLSQPHKGPHDLNIDPNRPFAV